MAAALPQRRLLSLGRRDQVELLTCNGHPNPRVEIYSDLAFTETFWALDSVKEPTYKNRALGTLKGKIKIVDADWWKPMGEEDVEQFLGSH